MVLIFISMYSWYSDWRIWINLVSSTLLKIKLLRVSRMIRHKAGLLGVFIISAYSHFMMSDIFEGLVARSPQHFGMVARSWIECLIPSMLISTCVPWDCRARATNPFSLHKPNSLLIWQTLQENTGWWHWLHPTSEDMLWNVIPHSILKQKKIVTVL